MGGVRSDGDPASPRRRRCCSRSCSGGLRGNSCFGSRRGGGGELFLFPVSYRMLIVVMNLVRPTTLARGLPATRCRPPLSQVPCGLGRWLFLPPPSCSRRPPRPSASADPLFFRRPATASSTTTTVAATRQREGASVSVFDEFERSPVSYIIRGGGRCRYCWSDDIHDVVPH